MRIVYRNYHQLQLLCIFKGMWNNNSLFIAKSTFMEKTRKFDVISPKVSILDKIIDADNVSSLNLKVTWCSVEESHPTTNLCNKVLSGSLCSVRGGTVLCEGWKGVWTRRNERLTDVPIPEMTLWWCRICNGMGWDISRPYDLLSGISIQFKRRKILQKNTSSTHSFHGKSSSQYGFPKGQCHPSHCKKKQAVLTRQSYSFNVPPYLSFMCILKWEWWWKAVFYNP